MWIFVVSLFSNEYLLFCTVGDQITKTPHFFLTTGIKEKVLATESQMLVNAIYSSVYVTNKD